MARRTQIDLTAEQRAELKRAARRHPKLYIRECASGILKVAEGQSVRQVALQGLSRPRRPETVAEWIQRYLDRGLAGLLVRPGRGRKPAFSPSARHGRDRPPRTG
jgi:hypothetical protein